jgi:hypothetical protein
MMTAGAALDNASAPILEIRDVRKFLHRDSARG